MLGLFEKYVYVLALEMASPRNQEPIYKISYDNAKVTIDLRRASNLQSILRRTQGFFFLDAVHLQNRKIVLNSVRKLAYDIPKTGFSTF